MKFHRMYALSIRHLYLIKGSFPRILDLIYWPTIQIILWGFISQFFTMYSDYYNNTIGVILSCAILYDFLFWLHWVAFIIQCLFYQNGCKCWLRVCL